MHVQQQLIDGAVMKHSVERNNTGSTNYLPHNCWFADNRTFANNVNLGTVMAFTGSTEA